MSPFIQPSQGTAWNLVGLTSAFPEITLEEDDACITAKCKAFSIPRTKDAAVQEVDIDLPGDLKDQVLVFKYKGKVHAIDHVSCDRQTGRLDQVKSQADMVKQQCPHMSFPLSKGSLFDIEDFGITLSAGITCHKHNWCFDLFSGQSDRGKYKLKVWEVQLRDPPTASSANGDGDEKEVWVRPKQRIG